MSWMKHSLWRQFVGSACALALFSGCEDDRHDPAPTFPLALVSSTIDVTGPIHYSVRQGERMLLEGVIARNGGGCVGGAALQLPELGLVEVHATTDSGLVWDLEVEVVETCTEAVVDFTNTSSPVLVFVVGGEQFLPAEVRLEGELVGTVTEVFSREMLDAWLEEVPRGAFEDSVDLEWFLEHIRAGRATWAARSPGPMYEGEFVFADGGVFELPPLRFDYGFGLVWKDEFDPIGGL